MDFGTCSGGGQGPGTNPAWILRDNCNLNIESFLHLLKSVVEPLSEIFISAILFFNSRISIFKKLFLFLYWYSLFGETLFSYVPLVL